VSTLSLKNQQSSPPETLAFVLPELSVWKFLHLQCPFTQQVSKQVARGNPEKSW
jgi:hypothetical protein